MPKADEEREQEGGEEEVKEREPQKQSSISAMPTGSLTCQA